MFGLPAPSDLGDDVLHVPGREELALLHLDDPAGLRGGDEQVGLAAQEGRDLQHVDDLGDGRALLGGVDVGDDRQAEALAHLGEHRQRLVEPHAARARQAGAVRLVERGLVDQPDAELAADLLQRRRHLQRMVAALHLAGAGEHGERRVIGERNAADPDGPVRRGGRSTVVSHSSPLCPALTSRCSCIAFSAK